MLPVAIGAQIVGDRTNNPLSPGTFQSLSLCAALFAHKNSSALLIKCTGCVGKFN
jgi:hypothetical protein